MQPTQAPAGQRTILYRIRQGSIPMEFDFTVAPLREGEELRGELEVTASSWIVPGEPRRMPLQSRHQVKRGFFNTFFTLAIIPEVDVMVTPVNKGFGGNSAFLIVISVLVAIVIIAAVLMMFRPGM